MTGITDLHHDTSSSSSVGPGRLVRQAREKANLSIEDLAAQIKLARFTLDAIERDDFAQLNEPVYVRGYYRKLAKVLPVLESDLLAAYERTAGHKAPPHPSKLILAGGPELGSGRRVSLKVAAGFILFGLIVGALAFWGKNRPTESAVNPAISQPASEPVLPQAESARAPVSPEPVAPAVSESPAPTSTLETPTAAAPASGPLQIQFNASSWTEVKDASGKVLLSGLVEGGGSQTLDGRPPFVVFLGNAPGVSITYKGQPVDTAPFRRGDNTARITLN